MTLPSPILPLFVSLMITFYFETHFYDLVQCCFRRTKRPKAFLRLQFTIPPHILYRVCCECIGMPKMLSHPPSMLMSCSSVCERIQFCRSSHLFFRSKIRNDNILQSHFVFLAKNVLFSLHHFILSLSLFGFQFAAECDTTLYHWYAIVCVR